MPLAFTIMTVVCTAIVLWADASGRNAVRGIAKLGASIGFIGVAVSRGALGGGTPTVLLLVALLLSAVGDVALIGKSKRAVAGGLGAFFFAHVAFIAMFVAIGVAPVAAVGTGALLTGLLPPVWRWLMPHTGALYPAVAAYVGVIVTMVASAGGALGAHPDWRHTVLLLAAVTFFASDLFVARQRFVTPDPLNRRIGLPLYYAAQLAFAFGMTTP